MRKYAPANNLIITLLLIVVATAFIPPSTHISLHGAWHSQAGSREETMTFVDGYFVHTVFDKAAKQFFYTWGGTYQVKDERLVVTVEFNTGDKERVGEVVNIPWRAQHDLLVTNVNEKQQSWKQLDKGVGDLAGVWRIAHRKQGNERVALPLAPRRTLKVLSGTRFQWVAINIQTKEFFGTGGGTYSYQKGKYTENIEFFSRDSSRVGASLAFNGKVQQGKEWGHTGLSSKGEPIDEMWRRLNTEIAKDQP